MTKSYQWLIAALLLFVCFLGISRDLWTPDEPRVAEISREMMLSPSTIPSLDGHFFLEKPPMYFWTVAAGYKLFGPSPAIARSISNIAGALTLLLVFLWGRREFSTTVGMVAAVGLASSAQFMITSHWIVMDSMLMFFTTAALWAGSDMLNGRGSLKTLALFYLSLVFAMWTKGLIGPVLVAIGPVMYAIFRRDYSVIKPLRPVLGVGIMLLSMASIALMIYLHDGYAGLHEWFWVNQVLRFTHPAYTGHSQPFYYYLEPPQKV